jgi:hypothetical protein
MKPTTNKQFLGVPDNHTNGNGYFVIVRAFFNILIVTSVLKINHKPDM